MPAARRQGAALPHRQRQDWEALHPRGEEVRHALAGTAWLLFSPDGQSTGPTGLLVPETQKSIGWGFPLYAVWPLRLSPAPELFRNMPLAPSVPQRHPVDLGHVTAFRVWHPLWICVALHWLFLSTSPCWKVPSLDGALFVLIPLLYPCMLASFNISRCVFSCHYGWKSMSELPLCSTLTPGPWFCFAGSGNDCMTLFKCSFLSSRVCKPQTKCGSQHGPVQTIKAVVFTMIKARGLGRYVWGV